MPGRYYGYNRVSSKEQHLDRGTKKIKDFCAANNYPLTKIFEDKVSGRNFNRMRYICMKEDVLRPGDTLIIPEYDRLGRAEETKKELEYFKEHHIRVIFLDIPTTRMDINVFPDEMSRMLLSYINDTLIDLFDLMARTELERKSKRQREGIEMMKKRGEWSKYGRPRKMSKEDFAKAYQQVERGELKTSQLMKQLGLNEDTYYRYVREYRKGEIG